MRGRLNLKTRRSRLTEEARRHGISVEPLLGQLVDERTRVGAAAPSSVTELPSWRLGVVGSLHRRGIYDDGRSIALRYALR